jgi:hypothetical protein
MQMEKLLRKIGSIFSLISFPKLFIVTSRPFVDQGKWKVLYGTAAAYRCLEFSTFSAANQEFESIRRFAEYGYGETIGGFLILGEPDTLGILRGGLYTDVVEKAMFAQNAQRTNENVNLIGAI